MKNKRQERILSLISAKDIETQEELSELLRSDGFNVTQATVSRDIRELKLVKTVSQNGKSKYSPTKSAIGSTTKQLDILSAAISHVDFAGNITVVKTIAGMAQGAAAALDSMHYEGIVGCVAGDDTIIIVMRDEKLAEGLKNSLARILGE